MQLRSRQCSRLKFAPKAFCCYPKWMSKWKTPVKSLFDLNQTRLNVYERGLGAFWKNTELLMEKLAQASRHRGPRPLLTNHSRGHEHVPDFAITRQHRRHRPRLSGRDKTHAKLCGLALTWNIQLLLALHVLAMRIRCQLCLPRSINGYRALLMKDGLSCH